MIYEILSKKLIHFTFHPYAIGVCIFTINKTMTMNPPIYNANVKR